MEVPELTRYSLDGGMGQLMFGKCEGCKKPNPPLDSGLADPVERAKYAGVKFYSVCARCHSTAYCSKTCQKSHWKEHKSECDKDMETQEQSSMTDVADMDIVKSWVIKEEGAFQAMLKSFYIEAALADCQAINKFITFELAYDPKAKPQFLIKRIHVKDDVVKEPQKAWFHASINIINPSKVHYLWMNTNLSTTLNSPYRDAIRRFPHKIGDPSWRAIVAYMNSKRCVGFEEFKALLPNLTDADVLVDEVKKATALKTCCDFCATKSKGLRACSFCGAVTYCSKECQASAWNSHKTVCFARWDNKYNLFQGPTQCVPLHPLLNEDFKPSSRVPVPWFGMP